MRLVKLDATSSTNDFLKELAASQMLENFTTVTAESQTKGRGQMGAQWHSEKGKNLIVSILVREALSDINQIYHLNVAVALAVISALERYEMPQLSIKWPNDIMSGNKKIGGILIENTIKTNGEIISIAGIGLNVNQTDFSQLPKASSLAVIMDAVFDKDELLVEIVNRLETNVEALQNNQSEGLWSAYISKLFKKGIPMPFEYKTGLKFMGIVQNVTPNGKLELLLEDDSVQIFEIKEIQMLY
ncbi:MAG TPA: biotin--[acetyl-CoA-carboxylase] ligase [Flavobacterium sp.]|nr:biotin--[acetyl-CoA-carboxylase] ligase [Flavobacterium sp.]